MTPHRLLVAVLLATSLAAADPGAGGGRLLGAARLAEAQRMAAVEALLPAFAMLEGGSGVVIDGTGLVLTNHHVIHEAYVAGRQRLRVRVGAAFRTARLVGTDPIGDLALLQVEDVGDAVLAHVPLADTEPAIGTPVVAIGNPFDAMRDVGDPAVTAGIVSCLHRYLDRYADVIQHDAPVNPGSSGGPLLTMDGRLVGINGLIQSRHGGRANTGIGIAIPVDQIRRLLPLLQAAGGGVIRRGFLRGLVLDQDEADDLQNGAEVRQVRPGSTAATCGLQAGDRVVSLEGQAIFNAFRLRGLLQTWPAGSELTLGVKRGDTDVALTVALDAYDPGSLGLMVVLPDNPVDRVRYLRRLRVEPWTRDPVVVEGVTGAAAQAAGIRPGDRIVAVAGRGCANFLAFDRILDELMAQDRVWAGQALELTFERDGRDGGVERLEKTLVLGSKLDELVKRAEDPPRARTSPTP